MSRSYGHIQSHSFPAPTSPWSLLQRPKFPSGADLEPELPEPSPSSVIYSSGPCALITGGYCRGRSGGQHPNRPPECAGKAFSRQQREGDPTFSAYGMSVNIYQIDKCPVTGNERVTPP